jgi:hypothetical protein
VSKKATDILLLQAAIEELHRCEASHHKTVFVDERFEGKTIWSGEVEVFELIGHPKAANCFAWMQPSEGQGARPVAILELWPINSPQMAVKTAIALDISPRFNLHPRP